MRESFRPNKSRQTGPSQAGTPENDKSEGVPKLQQHLSDLADVAELYCMNRLPGQEAAAVEEHILQCPDCAQFLEETQQFVDALRSALGRSQDLLARKL